MHKIYPKRIQSDRTDVVNLLASEGIRFEENVDITFGHYESGKLVATASIFKNIIKCVVIDSAFTGGAMFNELMTVCLNEIARRNYEGAFVYTKPMYEKSFATIGFKLIETAGNDLIFMERNRHGFDEYIKNLSATKIDDYNIGAIVLNANPFTLGHRFLIDYAYRQSNHLHIFVVSEDESYFKTDDRYNMVKEAISDLKDVTLHKTDYYLVSSATFPSYFIQDDSSVTETHARLDARIFKYHIAKALDIDYRYVGSEPASFATNIYNLTMSKVFMTEPKPGKPTLIEIPRKEKNGQVISASLIRKYINDGHVEKIKDLVPTSTYDYIIDHKLY